MDKIDKKELVEILVSFQIYLNSLGSITDYDWDFEKVAKKFTSVYKSKTNNLKPNKNDK